MEDRGQPGESRQERIDRELIELLNELRVALPGVQVLFAFLLTVPFSQGFTSADNFQRNLYFATLGLTALSSVLLIAPSSYHRLNFRSREKERLLLTSNRWSIAGLMALAVAMTCAVVLVADFLYKSPMPIIAGAAAAAFFGYFWVGVPLKTRFTAEHADH
jgi:Flp pilus assembly protein TadB